MLGRMTKKEKMKKYNIYLFIYECKSFTTYKLEK